MTLAIRIFLLFILLTLLIDLARARTIDTIVIHTTDMSPKCGAKCIDKYHKSLGWDSCGYHFIVMPDGIIEKCRDIDTIGAHVKDHNHNTIGIAWAGNKQITDIQKRHLFWLVRVLKNYYKIPNVKAHNEFDTAGDKTCPSIDISEVR